MKKQIKIENATIKYFAEKFNKPEAVIELAIGYMYGDTVLSIEAIEHALEDEEICEDFFLAIEGAEEEIAEQAKQAEPAEDATPEDSAPVYTSWDEVPDDSAAEPIYVEQESKAAETVEIGLSVYSDEQAVTLLNTIANMQGVTDARVFVSWIKEDTFGTPVESELVDCDHREDLQNLRDDGAKDWLANTADWLFDGQDYDERGVGWYTQEGYAYRFHFDRVEVEFSTGKKAVFIDPESIEEFVNANIPVFGADGTSIETATEAYKIGYGAYVYADAETPEDRGEDPVFIASNEIDEFKAAGRKVYVKAEAEIIEEASELTDSIADVAANYADYYAEDFIHLDDEELDEFKETGRLLGQKSGEFCELHAVVCTKPEERSVVYEKLNVTIRRQDDELAARRTDSEYTVLATHKHETPDGTVWLIELNGIYHDYAEDLEFFVWPLAQSKEVK